MTDKKTFVVYKEWRAAFDKMSNEQAGELVKAIFKYQDGETDISFDDPGLPLLFEIIKGRFDKDSEKYKDVCDKNRENGGKGGRPSKTEKTQENPKNPVGFEKSEKTQPNPKNPDNDSDNDNDFDNDSDNDYDKGKDKGVQGEKEKSPVATATPFPSVNYEAIAEDYNNTCKSLPRITTLSDARRKAIRARISTRGVEEIHRAFELAEQSDFLKGANNRNWTANFDWIMKDANIAKILDGNYTNRPRDSGPPGQEDGFDWLARQLKEGGFK